MGKSSKKPKSDRINALRKQYDAFLEEDKKRKERNEYILGKLDKMRYSTALVPVRHKCSAPDTRAAVVKHFGYQPESIPNFQSSSTDQKQLYPNAVKNNEDSYLLEEISKKYILIPKLRSSFMNDIKPNQTTESVQEIRPPQENFNFSLKLNTTENTDWKSKYEILNILKNEDNEKQVGMYPDFADDSVSNVHKESFFDNTHEKIASRYGNIPAHVEPSEKYVNDFPEKDLPNVITASENLKKDTLDGNNQILVGSDFQTDAINYGLPNGSENNRDIAACTNLNTNTINENKILVTNDYQTDAIDYKLQNLNLEYDNSELPNTEPAIDVINYQQQQNVYMSPAETNLCTNESIDVKDEVNTTDDPQNNSKEQLNLADSKHVYRDNNQIGPAQVMSSEGIAIDTISYSPTETDQICEDNHLTTVNNIQESESINSVQMKTDLNVNPEEITDIQRDIDPIINEQVVEQIPVDINESIDEFNSEQRDMFYREPTENSDNQLDDANAYNPDYSQNEYQQEYAYYDNTQAGAYPVELNDEEVEQQYDASYEQQYGDSVQQQYDQPYQEPQAIDQLEPEFDVQQFEQQFEIENQGKIEEAIDFEDGYTPQHNEIKAVEIEKSKSEAVVVTASEQVMG